MRYRSGETMRAILITKDDEYNAALTDVPESDLPEGDTIVDVEYSTLNYKDSLALTGSSPVVRKFPMVPGVDFVGTVRSTESTFYPVGSSVILNGWGVGELHWGGFAEVARVESEWLVPRPSAISPLQSMAIGTAGYTAMLCVLALEAGKVLPDRGEIIVTGATGGVGSVAVALLAKLGYSVVASTGKAESVDYLQRLGAGEVIARSELSEPGRPLGRERWAGAIDTVGSHTLANVCSQIRYGGTVAACGLAQGMDLFTTVMPFILRGVTLRGIDSVNAPHDRRIEAWDRLAVDLDMDLLDVMTSVVGLRDLFDLAPRHLAGHVTGRVVVEPAQ